MCRAMSGAVDTWVWARHREVWELPVLEFRGSRWAHQGRRGLEAGPRSRALLGTSEKAENGVFDLVYV